MQNSEPLCNFLPTSKSYAILVLQDVFVWKQVRCAPPSQNFITLLNSFQRSRKTILKFKVVQFSRLAFHFKKFQKRGDNTIFFSVPIFYFLLDSHNYSANNSLHSDALNNLIFFFFSLFWLCPYNFHSQRRKDYFSNAFLILIS